MGPQTDGWRLTQHLVTPPEDQSGPSVGDEEDKCDGEGASSHWISFNVAQLCRRKTERRLEKN